MAEFKYEVQESIGVISERPSKSGILSKEVNIVKWNDGEPKYDIRIWYEDDKETKKPQKGLDLTKEELIELRDIINRALA